MTQLTNGLAITPSTDGTFTFPAGVNTILVSGRSADGSKVAEDNGGAGATFGPLTIDVASLTGSTGLAITIPAAGSESNLTILAVGGTSDGGGLTLTSGQNGDNSGAAGDVDANSLDWGGPITPGVADSITGVGSDGSVTFTWTEPSAAHCASKSSLFAALKFTSSRRSN